MVREQILGKMAKSMTVNGKRTKGMVRVQILGKMAISIWVNFKMI